MKALSDIEIYGLSFILITISILVVSLHSDAFSQENKKKFDMVLLSQNYSGTGFAHEIVGEILNNGSSTAKSVEISATLYDDRDKKVGYESTRTQPTTIHPGDKSTFNLPLLNATIESVADRYEFTVKWMDEHSSDYFTQLMGGKIADNSAGNDDKSDDEDN